MTELTLYAIEEELEQLLDTIEVCPEELRAELDARISEYVGSEATKIDSIGRVLSQYDAVQTHAKSEIERLQARRQAAENNARRLEAYVLRVIAQRGGKALKGRHYTLYAGHSQSLIVDDADAVPERFKRTTITVDVPKTPVKEALKAGETVQGVHLEEREYLVKR